MGWPEAMVAIIASLNTVLLAWLATRQQQVKKALNGHEEAMQQSVRALQDAVLQGAPTPSQRVPGVLDDPPRHVFPKRRP